MKISSFFGTTLSASDITPLPTPDNDNLRLLSEGNTPAEFMQWARREKERLRRERVADERLLTCPEHRLTWDITLAMEKCCRWHYYGIREA